MFDVLLLYGWLMFLDVRVAGYFIFGHGGSVGRKVEGGEQGISPPAVGRKAIKNPAAAGCWDRSN